MSKTEDKIRIKPEKTLKIFTDKQFSRAFENLISAEKNIHLGERKEDLSKYASASGYVLSAMQNLVNLKYAYEELQRRYHSVTRDSRRKKKEMKIFMSSSSPLVDIGIPDWLCKGE